MSRWKLCSVLVVSRILWMFLYIVLDYVFNDYDTSTKLANPQKETIQGMELLSWDSLLFQQIGVHGYEFEHEHAFFPGVPVMWWTVNRVIGRQMSVIAMFLLVNISFVISGLILHRISEVYLQSQKTAVWVVLIYSVQSSSVFMIVPYTECMFNMFTFWGILLMSQNKPMSASILFALASLLRSNGVVNAGFLLYSLGLQQLQQRKFHGLSTLKCLVGVIIIALPSLTFQWYGRWALCWKSYRVWCDSHFGPYSYVQKEYWGVGFLNYFQFRQVPHFVLASPTIVASFLAVWDVVQRSPRQFVSLYLWQERGFIQWREVFAYQLLGMCVIAISFMNIQVVTRFLSCCPLLYWYLGAQVQKGGLTGYIIWTYCWTYCLLGILLFSNFYPWT